MIQLTDVQLRNMSDREVMRTLGACGDPVIEDLCRRLEGAEHTETITELTSQKEELADEVGEKEAEIDRLQLHHDRLKKALEEAQQQVRNLGGVTA